MNGIRSKWSEVLDLVQQHDIVTLVESKIDNKVTTSSISIPGYFTLRQDRTCNGGGIVTFVRDVWKFTELSKLQEKYVHEGLEVLLVQIKPGKPTKQITLVNLYRPPNAKSDWFTKLDDLTLELLQLGGALVFLGDLNADLLKPERSSTVLLHRSLKLAGLKVDDTSGLTPTRISASCASCLDLIICSQEIEVISYSTIASGASDHFQIQATVKVNEAPKPKPVLKRSFKRVNMEELNLKVSGIILHNPEASSPDDLLHEWHTAITSIMDQVAPIRSYPQCKKKCKWMTSEVRQLILKRDAVARKLQSCHPNPVSDFQNDLKRLRKITKSKLRREAKVYGRSLLTGSDSTRDAWKFLRETTFTTSKGERVSMDASILNDHLAATVQMPKQADLSDISGCDNSECFTLSTLNVVDTLQMLVRLPSRTATGPDELPANLLKQLAPSIAENLTFIMNSCITQEKFPNQWKEANVAAIWKGKGSKGDPSNYRPISILPVLARMFEKFVAKQLTRYCHAYSIIPTEQFGFRASSSCELALLSALNNWMEEIDNGKVVGALLIDLSKAFDTVPHQQLLSELLGLGCDGSTVQFFKSYLSGRKQRVKQGATLTEWRDVTRGVPQGSSISPLLFNIFVRKLPSVSNSPTIQFADDVTNSEADKSEQIVAYRLAESFQQTKTFCENHELMINTAKTQFVVFKQPSRKLSPDYAITLDGLTIMPSGTVKLLGVTLDQHLTFGSHIDSTVKKARGVLGSIARAASHLPRELLRMAYLSLARSLLEYASATFASASATQLAKLDRVQKMAARIICRAPAQAHSAPLLELLQLEPLGTRRHAHVLNLVDSILNGTTHPALLDMFERADDGAVKNNSVARVGIGRRRFAVYAKEFYTKNV